MLASFFFFPSMKGRLWILLAVGKELVVIILVVADVGGAEDGTWCIVHPSTNTAPISLLKHTLSYVIPNHTPGHSTLFWEMRARRPLDC